MEAPSVVSPVITAVFTSSRRMNGVHVGNVQERMKTPESVRQTTVAVAARKKSRRGRRGGCASWPLHSACGSKK
jgi:hypothetical protein